MRRKDNFTKFMHDLFEAKNSHVENLNISNYSREMLMVYIIELQLKEELGKKDHAAALRRRIVQLFKECDIEVGLNDSIDKLKESARQLESEDEIDLLLIDELYSIYKNAPSSQDYMRRFIDRLTPEFSDDSVRMAILKKFVRDTDYCTNQIKEEALERARAKQDFKKPENEKEEMQLILDNLDEETVFAALDSRLDVLTAIKEISGTDPKILERLNPTLKNDVWEIVKRVSKEERTDEGMSANLEWLLDNMLIHDITDDMPELFEHIEKNIIWEADYNSRCRIELILECFNYITIDSADDEIRDELFKQLRTADKEYDKINSLSMLLEKAVSDMDNIMYGRYDDDEIDKAIRKLESFLMTNNTPGKNIILTPMQLLNIFIDNEAVFNVSEISYKYKEPMKELLSESEAQECTTILLAMKRVQSKIEEDLIGDNDYKKLYEALSSIEAGCIEYFKENNIKGGVKNKIKAAKRKYQNKYIDTYKKQRDSLKTQLESFELIEKERYKDRVRKARQKEDKVTLLKLANDLASGNFRTGGNTKTNLYLFAMAFGMSVSVDNSDYDDERDIEKNLFGDFYADNLLRYICEEYTSNSSGFEAEPTGEGINYKNFFEVICLWCIKNEKLSAREKINTALRLTEQCKKSAINPVPATERTKVFKNVFNEIIKIEDEKTLVKELCAKYYIDKSKNAIQCAWEEYTARQRYEDTYNIIRAKYYDVESIKVDLDFGLEMKVDEFFEDDVEKILGKKFDEGFKTSLKKLDKRLHVKDWDIAKFKDDYRITRNDLIAINYYYYYINMREERRAVGEENYVPLTLAQIYDDFSDMVNDELEEARYQPISEKNIFDVFVIFSLYRQLK